MIKHLLNHFSSCFFIDDSGNSRRHWLQPPVSLKNLSSKFFLMLLYSNGHRLSVHLPTPAFCNSCAETLKSNQIKSNQIHLLKEKISVHACTHHHHKISELGQKTYRFVVTQ